MSRYKAYPEYKDSEVEWLGRLPKDWDAIQLKRIIAALESGVSVNAADIPAQAGEIGVLKTSCVYTRSFRSSENKTVFDAELSRVKCPVQKGAIIISRMNTPELVGASALVLTDEPGVFLPDRLWQTVFFEPARTSPRFLAYFMMTEGFRTQISLAAEGASSSMQNIAKENYLAIHSAVPTDLSEAEKIANFLDHETAKIDGLIAKQQELIALLQEKRQAVISHAVTKGLNPAAPMKDSGVEWLGEVPAHWVVAKLAFHYEVLLGKMLDDKKIKGDFLRRYLRNTDVQWDRINVDELPMMDFSPDEVERYSVKMGDLLVCEGGEIGRAAIWNSDENCFYQKALHRLRPFDGNKESSRFMFYQLFNAVAQGRFVSGAGKSTIAHLPAETFRQYRFVFPPADEQCEIVSFLDNQKSQFGQLEEKARAQIELMQERRTALISAAVTGKIDVRDWQPA